MFDMGTPGSAIVMRSVLVFLAVLVGLRLAGKREVGQVTVFDLVVILLISNAVQNAMVGHEYQREPDLNAGEDELATPIPPRTHPSSLVSTSDTAHG